MGESYTWATLCFRVYKNHALKIPKSVWHLTYFYMTERNEHPLSLHSRLPSPQGVTSVFWVKYVSQYLPEFVLCIFSQHGQSFKVRIQDTKKHSTYEAPHFWNADHVAYRRNPLLKLAFRYRPNSAKRCCGFNYMDCIDLCKHPYVLNMPCSTDHTQHAW